MNFEQFTALYQKVPVEEYPNQVLENIPQPLVSCRVSTYQQADYIKQCLDGMLMQITDFPFEIVVGEDASTDGTREICVEYARKHPDKIRLFLHSRENNIRVSGNPTGLFQVKYTRYMSRGKYLAMCEGDDFWTDPYKLQKQVDFLEKNEEYGLVFTNLEIMRNNQIAGTFHQPDAKTVKTDLESLIVNNPIVTLTVIYRNELLEHLSQQWEGKQWSMGDYPLWLEIAGISKIHYIDNVTGVYRVTSGSASQHFNPVRRKEFLRDTRDVSLFYAVFYEIDVRIRKLILKRYLTEIFNMAYINRLPELVDKEDWKIYKPESLKSLIIYIFVRTLHLFKKPKNVLNNQS